MAGDQALLKPRQTGIQRNGVQIQRSVAHLNQAKLHVDPPVCAALEAGGSLLEEGRNAQELPRGEPWQQSAKLLIRADAGQHGSAKGRSRFQDQKIAAQRDQLVHKGGQILSFGILLAEQGQGGFDVLFRSRRQKLRSLPRSGNAETVVDGFRRQRSVGGGSTLIEQAQSVAEGAVSQSGKPIGRRVVDLNAFFIGDVVNPGGDLVW